MERPVEHPADIAGAVGQGCMAKNAQQQFVCSRRVLSPESIKQAKELHPLFSSSFEEEELQQLRLVDSIKQYRWRVTIFEINASSWNLSSQLMLPSSRRTTGPLPPSSRASKSSRSAWLTQP